MRYLLDSNVVIAMHKGRPSVVSALKERRSSEIAISALVMHELFYGAYKSDRRRESLDRVEGVRFDILEVDLSDARSAAEVRATLERIGKPIAPYDVLIAGQAVAGGLTLVTRNTREFSRVPGLRCEDWES